MKTAPEVYTYVTLTRGFYKGRVGYVTEVYKASRSCIVRFTDRFIGTDGKPKKSQRHIERAWSSVRIATPEEVDAETQK